VGRLGVRGGGCGLYAAGGASQSGPGGGLIFKFTFSLAPTGLPSVRCSNHQEGAP
jgi:hypothetical protein